MGMTKSPSSNSNDRELINAMMKSMRVETSAIVKDGLQAALAEHRLHVAQSPGSSGLTRGGSRRKGGGEKERGSVFSPAPAETTMTRHQSAVPRSPNRSSSPTVQIGAVPSGSRWSMRKS